MEIKWKILLVKKANDQGWIWKLIPNTVARKIQECSRSFPTRETALEDAKEIAENARLTLDNS